MDHEDEIIEEAENLEITQRPQTEVSGYQIASDTETDVEYSRDKMKMLIDQ